MMFRRCDSRIRTPGLVSVHEVHSGWHREVHRAGGQFDNGWNGEEWDYEHGQDDSDTSHKLTGVTLCHPRVPCYDFQQAPRAAYSAAMSPLRDPDDDGNLLGSSVYIYMTQLTRGRSRAPAPRPRGRRNATSVHRIF